MTDAWDCFNPRTSKQRLYSGLLLAVAGLGGLLYGIDVGIIGGALPYLIATSHLTTGELSMIVAAVLLGSVLSTFFAGLIADLIGRRRLMVVSGMAFVASIPVIAMSQGYGALFLGRVLQGVSGGFIGVVVPLYLAECLGADVRGKGTGFFQWLLTFGIFVAALIGVYYSYRVHAMQQLGDHAALLRFEDQAWRRIFWASIPPGALFILGSVLLTESPRWLFRNGQTDAAFQALCRSRSELHARLELDEMADTSRAQAVVPGTIGQARARSHTLLRRKYVVPFLIACAVLFCNTATGMNSVIGYNTNILLQSGLSDVSAHWGYVLFTGINFGMTVIGVSLVDRKGRRFLLTLGTVGMTSALLVTGSLFLSTEHRALDLSRELHCSVSRDQTLDVVINRAQLQRFAAASNHPLPAAQLDRATFQIIYSYGGFTNQTALYRTDESSSQVIHIARANALPSSPLEARFLSPFADLESARAAPLVIKRATLAQAPDPRHGWLVAASLFVFVSFFALGPGVCVWLALSELMPTRIRSNGMSIALVINQLVSTLLAAIFLPVVSRYGYSVIFFLFAGFSVLYLLVVTLILPETKGKTLEEIEASFEHAV